MIRYTIVTIRDDALDSRNKIRREDEGIAYTTQADSLCHCWTAQEMNTRSINAMRLLQRKKGRRPRVAD